MSKEKIYHYARYIISGGVSAIVLFLCLYVLHKKLGIGVVVSSVIAYALSFSVGFIMQKFWTWGERGHTRTRRQFLRYGALAIFNVVMNGFGMYVLADFFSLWYILSQFVVAGIIAIWSYFFYKNFVFQEVLQTNMPQV